MPGAQYHFNSRGNYEDDIDNEPLYDPVAPRIDYEVHDFDANPRDEANRRLAYRRDNARQQDVIYDGPADDLPMYHGSKVRSATWSTAQYVLARISGRFSRRKRPESSEQQHALTYP